MCSQADIYLGEEGCCHLLVQAVIKEVLGSVHQEGQGGQQVVAQVSGVGIHKVGRGTGLDNLFHS